MSFWNLARVPEPEEMDDAGEVESYSSAAAARHLDAIDDTFVEHLLRLLERAPIGGGGLRWGLDIGTGPAQIPIKILRKVPGLAIVGIDRSRNMLAEARRKAIASGVSQRLALVVADGHALPFEDSRFSVVMSNSVLHHARDPVALLKEMARVAQPAAALLLRDLRRPSRLALRWHLWRHGRHYEGRMRKLFDDSVQAAYRIDELEAFIRESKVEGFAPFRFRGAHIGIERPPSAARSERKSRL
jgi:ubiquinone/menaquinone biosynthesis C-methylase UbiE